MSKSSYNYRRRPMEYYPVMMALAALATIIGTVLLMGKLLSEPKTVDILGRIEQCGLSPDTAVTATVEGRTYHGKLSAEMVTNRCFTPFYIGKVPDTETNYRVTVGNKTVNVPRAKVEEVIIK